MESGHLWGPLCIPMRCLQCRPRKQMPPQHFASCFRKPGHKIGGQFWGVPMVRSFIFGSNLAPPSLWKPLYTGTDFRFYSFYRALMPCIRSYSGVSEHGPAHQIEQFQRPCEASTLNPVLDPLTGLMLRNLTTLWVYRT